MKKRFATAKWLGTGKEGTGTVSSQSGAFSDAQYSYKSRFEEGTGTNPEELIGAAHAACFSMALSNILSQAGFKVNSVKTEDKVYIEKKEEGFTITKIEMDCVGDVEGCDENQFIENAEKAKANCPVSRALKVEMSLNAKLK